LNALKVIIKKTTPVNRAMKAFLNAIPRKTTLAVVQAVAVQVAALHHLIHVKILTAEDTAHAKKVFAFVRTIIMANIVKYRLGFAKTVEDGIQQLMNVNVLTVIQA
jgi:hypothetical protein